jgi:hypothetical protein
MEKGAQAPLTSNLEEKQGRFMIALSKTIRKFFLPAVILAGSMPFAFTHWMPCLGIAPAVFALPASPVESHPGANGEQTARHGLCWRAEAYSGKTCQFFTAKQTSGMGEPAHYPCRIQIPPCCNLSSLTPAVLSVLRI